MSDTPVVTEAASAPAAESAAPKIILHHLNASRSQRVMWLLEELEIPYEIKQYQRGADKLAPEELKKVNPLGKAPAITDGDLNLAESGAITEYLINKYGGEKFTPPAAGYVENLYWTHYCEGSLMPLLVNKIIFESIPQRSPFLIRPLARALFKAVSESWLDPQIKNNINMIEKHLEKTKGGWFAGGDEPTSADFQMYFPLVAVAGKEAGKNLLGPNIKAYIKLVQERPAFKRTVEKGGSMDL